MTTPRPDFLETPDLTVAEAMHAVHTDTQPTNRAFVSGVFHNEKAEKRAGVFRIFAIGFTLIAILAATTTVLSPLIPATGPYALAIGGSVTGVSLILAMVFGRLSRVEWFTHEFETHAGFFHDLKHQHHDDNNVWDDFHSNLHVYTAAQILADRDYIAGLVRQHVSNPEAEHVVEAIRHLPLPDSGRIPASPDVSIAQFRA